MRPSRVSVAFTQLLILALTISGFASAALATGSDLQWALGLSVIVWSLSILFYFLLRGMGAFDDRILPIISVLLCLGSLVQYRVDPDLAASQALWLGISVLLASALLFAVKDHRVLERYKYIYGAIGIILLLSPALLGVERGGARLWIDLGPVSLQPGEPAKVLLTIFFAAYLADRQGQLSRGSESLFHLPRMADVGPLIAVWALSLVVLVTEKDLGSSLIFFGVFLVMLYAATRRVLYPIIGITLFGAGAALAYRVFSHLRVRVDVWLDPWSDFYGQGYQVGQSLLALAGGGLSGRGLGNGFPSLVPAAATDFPFAIIGEELGLIGSASILILFALMAARGFGLSLSTSDLFGKLLVAGLTAAIALQALVIIGGATKAIPMTGVTLPFVSYGGSSLLTNMILVALILRASSGPRARRSGGREAPGGRS